MSDGSILEALGWTVLDLREDGRFVVVGTPSAWFVRLCPDSQSSAPLEVSRLSIFLADVLGDPAVWSAPSPNSLGSWTETDPSGEQIHLRAVALTRPGRRTLLLEDARSRETEGWLQTARVRALEHERLLRDLERHDVLLNCIVHDLAGPLTSIKGVFYVLASGKLEEKQRAEMLDIGIRQCDRQEALIRSILDAFRDEMVSVESLRANLERAPDAALVVQAIARAMEPAFRGRAVTLVWDAEGGSHTDWRVLADASRLERILTNLLENALRHAPPQSEVKVRLTRQDHGILFSVEDRGRGVPPSLVPGLFQIFTQGAPASGKAGLGLYFCRTTVEKWGGAMGYLPRDGGGSCFWFRLLRPGEVTTSTGSNP